MDDLGYDALWFAEHHFQHEGYECIPNLLMFSVHLAHMTRNLRFGCGFNITPMWHPLRLAEDFAMADILTDGRVIFGVGRGYHTREVESLGGPMVDMEANREIFEEQVEIIFKAFNEESFSHQGKYYTLPPNVPYRGYELKELTLVPRPATPTSGVLAAHRQRDATRSRFHDQAPHQRHRRWWLGDHGGVADLCLPRRGTAGWPGLATGRKPDDWCHLPPR